MSDAIDWTLYAQLSDVVHNRGEGNEPAALKPVTSAFAPDERNDVPKY